MSCSVKLTATASTLIRSTILDRVNDTDAPSANKNGESPSRVYKLPFIVNVYDVFFGKGCILQSFSKKYVVPRFCVSEIGSPPIALKAGGCPAGITAAGEPLIHSFQAE